MVMTAQLDHVALHAHCPETLVRFYMLLGFEAVNLEAYLAGTVPFPSVRLNASTILDFFPHSPHRQPGMLQPANHICLALAPDAHAALLRVVHAHAIRVEEGPVRRSGARGTGISVYVRDPEANLVEFRYYAQPQSSGASDR